MSYDNDKKAFDKTVKRIVDGSKGKVSHKAAADRLRQAIDKQKYKNNK